MAVWHLWEATQEIGWLMGRLEVVEDLSWGLEGWYKERLEAEWLLIRRQLFLDLGVMLPLTITALLP